MAYTKNDETSFCGYCMNRKKVIFFKELSINGKRYGVDFDFEVFDIGMEGTSDSLRIPLSNRQQISEEAEPSAKFYIDDRLYILDSKL